MANEFVGLAEGHAVFHQVVGEVGGQEQWVGGGGFAGVQVDGHVGNHLCIDLEGEAEGVDGVKQRFLVFL